MPYHQNKNRIRPKLALVVWIESACVEATQCDFCSLSLNTHTRTYALGVCLAAQVRGFMAVCCASFIVFGEREGEQES